MSLSVQISLPTGYIELNDIAQKRQVVSFGPGSRTIRAEFATSPVSDGSVLIGARADREEGQLLIRVWGEVPADIIDQLADLEAAFNQWDYTVTITLIDYKASTLSNVSIIEIWSGCTPANMERGNRGTYEIDKLKNGGWQDLRITVPKQPSSYTYNPAI